MRKRFLLMGILLAAAVSYCGELQAEPLQSGPQVGEKVPGPFSPLNITGTNAGEKCCQYCKCGSRPAVAVFARTVTPAVIQLLKTIDRTAAANREQGLGSYAVFCSDEEQIGRQLQGIAQKEQLQNIVLTVYKGNGPEKYRLSSAADVTVLVYRHFTGGSARKDSPSPLPSKKWSASNSRITGPTCGMS